MIARCLVLVAGVQGVGDPKGVSTVPSTTLTCSSSRCNCLCDPPLPQPSARASTNPYAFGRAPHSPVWVEDVFWEIRSVVSKEGDRRGSNPRPSEPQSSVIGFWALPGVAESAYLSRFHCWWLPTVSVCCALSGVRSGVNRWPAVAALGFALATVCEPDLCACPQGGLWTTGGSSSKIGVLSLSRNPNLIEKFPDHSHPRDTNSCAP